MCMGGSQPAPPPASKPAAAPAPSSEAPVAPIINAESNASRIAAANSAGRGGLKVDLASSVGSTGGSGLNIPTGA